MQVVAAIYDECALEPFGGHIMFLLRRILAADRFACGIDHPQGWLAPDHIDRWAFDEAHALIEAARRDSWNALDRASDEEAIR